MRQVISDEQKALNQALHRESENFGNRADGAGLGGNLDIALKRMHELNVCNSVLDYGTGKGQLVKKLKKTLDNLVEISGYDPAVPEWENKPTNKFDIVTCLDVLEHIELDTIDAVLQDIKSLTRNFCYLVIDLQPAVKKLQDGRNAHILLAPPDWWITKIAQLYTCHSAFTVNHARGLPQKLVIAATNKREILPLMYGFLIKMKLFDFEMNGGPLGVVKKIKK